MGKIKYIIIIILNLITLPLVFLSILFVPYLAPDFIDTKHCFGNCIYQIKEEDGLYKYQVKENSYDNVGKLGKVIKYKDDKNDKDAYVILKYPDESNLLRCGLIENKNKNASLTLYECNDLPEELKKRFDEILES